MENLNRQLDYLGSRRKASVSAPEYGEVKPDLVFKAPTYSLRVSRYLSTRQGGTQNFTVVEISLIFLALMTVRVLRGRTIINNLCRLCSSVKNNNIYELLLKSFLQGKGFKKVYSIKEPDNLHTFCCANKIPLS